MVQCRSFAGCLILRPWLASLLPPDGTALQDMMDCMFCFSAIAGSRVHDALAGQFATNTYLVRWLTGSIDGLYSPGALLHWDFRSFSSRVLASWYVEMDRDWDCLIQDLARWSGQDITVGWDLFTTTVHSWGRSCRSFSVGGSVGQRYWRLGTEG